MTQVAEKFIYTRTFAGRLVCAWLVLFSCSCLVPPQIDKANVIPESELKVISTVRVGKDLVSKGRMDLAEVEFRKAVHLQATNVNAQTSLHSNTFNDLGYVLHAQGRYEEAKTWYLKALEREPQNVIARGNLARLYYQEHDFKNALRENNHILDTLAASDLDSLAVALGTPINASEEVRALRNLAVIYYTVGALDEALCYSALAFAKANDVYQAGLHARLLLSLDQTQKALQLLQGVVQARNANVPAKLMLDYAIALFLNDDKALAKTAASRVLTAASSRKLDRSTVRLLLIAVALAQTAIKEAELWRDSLLQEEEDFCKLTEWDRDNYWPLAMQEAVEKVVIWICDDKKE